MHKTTKANISYQEYLTLGDVCIGDDDADEVESGGEGGRSIRSRGEASADVDFGEWTLGETLAAAGKEKFLLLYSMLSPVIR